MTYYNQDEQDYQDDKEEEQQGYDHSRDERREQYQYQQEAKAKKAHSSSKAPILSLSEHFARYKSVAVEGTFKKYVAMNLDNFMKTNLFK